MYEMRMYDSCMFTFLLIFVFNYANCEWFSSLGHMEDLIHEETDLLTSLREYISVEEAKIQRIKRLADEYQEISNYARSNIDKYLGHPINQYRLVKRLASEWSEMEQLVTEDFTKIFLSNFSSKRDHFPNDEDIKGSALAIMRLQDTYKLDTHEIAQGIVKGLKANQSLTAEDCFHIGRTAYLEKDFYHCVLWMNEVLEMNEQSYTSFSRFDILDHLSYCSAQQGDIEKAFNITNELLKINPSIHRLHDNLLIYSNLLQNSSKLAAYKDDCRSDRVLSEKPFIKKYIELCSNHKITIPVKVERKLKCYLWTNKNHPRLILQPAKLEELWHSPHLVRFHEIVSDDEINQIKAIAKPKLNRATVHNPDTGEIEHARYRVSKSAWLDDESHPLVGKLSRRISDITGLSLETAETLQVANYGIGGQYEPHFDYIGKPENVLPEEGNRVATFLIYLSDVSYGGSTVFPHPGIDVKPIKGSAAFWYNLFPSGAGDHRTKHAACPVLTGVKWVANKWIHERGQEFIRKCNLVQALENRLF